MSHDETFVDNDLRSFMEALWRADENRLVPNVDYRLDPGGRTRYSLEGPDQAEDPLFEYVNPEVFERPTFKAFVNLLDNYSSETGVVEDVTQVELRENYKFCGLVYQSKVFQMAIQFLRSKGKLVAYKTEKQFKDAFYDMWFKMYKRDRSIRGHNVGDSSGFEHVFVGETRNMDGNKEVTGFHNWITFYQQEKAGNLDYKGFMGTKNNPHLYTVQFSWKDQVKPKGSMFIGVSPEFEVAVYTVCFFMGHSDYKIAFDGDEVIMKCHKRDGKYLGSCYPVNIPDY